jgi:prepilin-type processing-associated H-X9-DG protein
MSANFENDPEFQGLIQKPVGRPGRRLFELLAILGIGALLVAFLLPFNRSAGPGVRRALCTNNLKQIALALHNYVAEHGVLPPARTVDASGQPLHSWRTLILPYLDQAALYQSIDLSKPWYDPVNAKALKTGLPVYQCPEAGGPPDRTTYLAITSPDGCLRPNEGRRLAEITDSYGSTLMLIEAGEERSISWMVPVDADESVLMRLGPKGLHRHAGGTNGCFVDGSVRFLKDSTPAKVRHALMSISGKDDDLIRDW